MIFLDLPPTVFDNILLINGHKISRQDPDPELIVLMIFRITNQRYLRNHNPVYESGDSFRDPDNCTCISVLLGNLGHPVVSAGLLVLYLDRK